MLLKIAVRDELPILDIHLHVIVRKLLEFIFGPDALHWS